ncbi:MAG: hypothetical protein C0P77_010615 [Thermoanaerobacterales bacterium]
MEQPEPDASDAIGTVLALLLLLSIVAYDPLTTARRAGRRRTRQRRGRCTTVTVTVSP